MNTPRLFAGANGAVNGLQNAVPTPNHPCTATSPNAPGGGCQTGAAPPNGNWQPAPITDACHDITVYEKFDLAAGSCEGNGLLIDISDPVNPVRIDAVADPLFAYWHGATFSNDGKKVFFTDEWGGGTGPRCRATDQLSWGANAIYEIVNRKLVFKSYYKLPVAQTTQENCVSHLPSLVPIPNRDVFVQAWYQGGASLVDFTDSSNPKEIGYFDRGPIPLVPPSTTLTLGGFWSTYWYNGAIYGSEIARGFDVFNLTPTADLTQAEIDFAKNRTVKAERFNPQSQDQLTWAAPPVNGGVGGNVPATLSLTIGAPAQFGAFTPGVARTYEATSPATVTSTAGDALAERARPELAEHRAPRQRHVLPAAAAAGPGPQRGQHRDGVQQRRLCGFAVEPVDVQRADLQRRGDAGLQPADQRERCAAHGCVQQDADVHPLDDAAVGSSSGAVGRKARRPQSFLASSAIRWISID